MTDRPNVSPRTTYQRRGYVSCSQSCSPTGGSNPCQISFVANFIGLSPAIDPPLADSWPLDDLTHLGPQPAQLGDGVIVAAIEVLDAGDLGLALGDQPGEDQRGGGA